MMRDRTRDGLGNYVEAYLLSHFPRFWRLVMAIPPLRRFANKFIISRAAGRVPSRPYPFSSMPSKGDSADPKIAGYTSWESLTDRSWFSRHLPPKELPIPPPHLDKIETLFKVRPEGPRLSEDSTILFMSFAQWFADGFLMTDQKDRRRTPTSHQIDLSPVYGLSRFETLALRVNSEAEGQRGRLKTESVNGEPYAPKLFDEGKFNFEKPCFDETHAVKSEFQALRPPLSFKKNRQRRGLKPEHAAALARTTFAFGSERANVTPFMAALNTLFLREHNRLAGALETAHPNWDDERVFQTARNINIVLLIKIVVEEYVNHITPYHFQLTADPSVSWHADWNRPNWIPIEFNLLYRWHSMTPDRFFIGDECVPLGDILQNNMHLTNCGLAGTLMSASRQRSWQLGLFNTTDPLIDVERDTVDQSRINRIGSYNDYREAFGYPRVTRFEQITDDPLKIRRLRDLYGDVANIEFTVGLLAEDVPPRAAVPPLTGRMVALDAFSQALTNPLLAKEVFNEQTFSKEGMETILATKSLKDILDRNLAPGQRRAQIGMTYHQPAAAVA
jgi:prostaglandin-endoperoxide synthase 2